MRILLVKTSSLGDVVHNLPVVSDLRRWRADLSIDWVVEEGFAAIPRLHPGVDRVLPLAWRRWRRSLLAAATRAEMRAFRNALRQDAYDLILDTQGLLKSALVARLARGRRAGQAATTAREPLAALCYDQRYAIDPAWHAVIRNRALAAAACAYPLAGPPDYGIASAPAHRQDAVLLTATSRDDKLWPEDRWIALGRWLESQGLHCHLPAGNATERARAERLAAAIPGARTVPPSDIPRLAALLAGSRLVVGVDTGLVHLAAAVGTPTLALYCATDPGLTGVLAASPALNLGGRAAPPTAAEAIAAAASLLG